MKRKILIAVSILLSVLMLCSCALLPSGNENEDENKLAFHLNRLPDIGAYESRDKVSYFSENGAQSSFTPRSDYGELVPYIYSNRRFNIRTDGNEEEIFGYRQKSYGFATADGKIITGGIYGGITTESLGDGRMVYIATALRTNEGTETPEELFWGPEPSCDIIASDGSWMIKCSNCFYTISDSGYICTADENGNGLVYDFSGNLVFDAMQLLGQEILIDLYYADMGKCVVSMYKTTAFWDYDEVQKFVPYTVCIGADGEILYDLDFSGWEIENYVDGRFIIRNNETDKYALCDLFGERLVTKLDRLQYDRATNSFIGYKADPDADQGSSLWVKYDMDGNEIVSFKVPYEETYGPEMVSSGSVTAVLCAKDSYANTDIYKLAYWIDFKNEKMIDIDFNYTDVTVLYAYDDYVYGGSLGAVCNGVIAFKADGNYDIYTIDGTYLKTLTDVNGNNIIIQNGFICYQSYEAPVYHYRFRSLTGRTDLDITDPFDNKKYDTFFSICGNYIAFNTYTDNASDGEPGRRIKLFNIRESEFEKDNGYTEFFKAETASGTFYQAVDAHRAYLLNKDLEVIMSLSFNDYA